MYKRLLFFAIVLSISEAMGLNFVAGSASGIFGKLFSSEPKVEEYKLESVSFSSTDKSSEGSATKVHLVVVYSNSVLAQDLAKRNPKDYFSMINQLKHDHASCIKIFEWNIRANNYCSPLVKVNHQVCKLKPYGMIVFAYSKNGGKGRGGMQSRYIVPPKARHIHINIERRKCTFTPT